jgi:hypothetical protein
MPYPIAVDFNGYESWSKEQFAQRAGWLAGAYAASQESRTAPRVLVATRGESRERRDALARVHPAFREAYGLQVAGTGEQKNLYDEQGRLSLPALARYFPYGGFSRVVTEDKSRLDLGSFNVPVQTFAEIDEIIQAALKRLRFILLQA